MPWIDQTLSKQKAIVPSTGRSVKVRAMRLAFVPISAKEAFGIMTSCREVLDGWACERTNADQTARLWVFATADACCCIVLAWVRGAFYVGTRASHVEVRHAA